MPSYSKDPGEELDYSVNWASWLVGADTIVSVDWVVPDGLAEPKAATLDGAKATVWLAGGEVGRSYPVECKVVTALGRKGERTFYVKIEQK